MISQLNFSSSQIRMVARFKFVDLSTLLKMEEIIGILDGVVAAKTLLSSSEFMVI